MALIIPTYQAECGLTIDNAYLVINDFQYNMATKTLDFNLLVFANKAAFSMNKPALEHGIYGSLIMEKDDFDNNILDVIYNAVLTKIENIIDKNQEDCDMHNTTLSQNEMNWLNLWELSYQKFIGTYLEEESPEDH